MTRIEQTLRTLAPYDAFRWAEDLFEHRDYYSAATVLQHLVDTHPDERDLGERPRAAGAQLLPLRAVGPGGRGRPRPAGARPRPRVRRAAAARSLSAAPAVTRRAATRPRAVRRLADALDADVPAA